MVPHIPESTLFRPVRFITSEGGPRIWKVTKMMIKLRVLWHLLPTEKSTFQSPSFQSAWRERAWPREGSAADRRLNRVDRPREGGGDPTHSKKGNWKQADSFLSCSPLSGWLSNENGEHDLRNLRRRHLHLLIMMNKQTCWARAMSPLHARGATPPQQQARDLHVPNETQRSLWQPPPSVMRVQLPAPLPAAAHTFPLCTRPASC